MTSPRPILIVNKNTPTASEVFGRLGSVRPLTSEEMTRETVKDADILIVRSETTVDRPLLEGSKVRFVGTVTIGTDHCDLQYLRSQGITFASAPGSNANSVAEYVTAALLSLGKKMGQQLRGRSIGIVGVGSVGKKVERMAKVLGLTVLLNDPPLQRLTGDPAYRPLDELMEADFVTLHIPLTHEGEDATYHLFDESRLLKMKKESVLINTSRGGVVDGSALKSALHSHHLSTAILDVWEGEPRIDVALLDNVMAGTPHIAGYSLDGKLNAVRMVAEKVAQFLGVPFEHISEPVGKVKSEVRIDVPQPGGRVEEQLYHIVRHAYDIELDDSMLRKIILMPAEEQGSHFMKLRSEYRTRREFENWIVAVPEEEGELNQILKDLGFRMGSKRQIS